ncbi:MAG: hypothetical protein ABIK73_08065 [candidate division WOR-3 bacterium]
MRELLFLNISEFTVSITSGEVTSITQSPSTNAYRFRIEQENARFSDKRIGEGNSAYAREQTAEINLHGNTKEMIVLTELLAKGRFAVIAQLNDGTYELYFHDNGGAKFVDERDTGTKMDDFNGIKLTTTHRQVEKAPKVPASVISTLTIA